MSREWNRPPRRCDQGIQSDAARRNFEKLPDQPSALVDIEFHQAFVAHLQQQRLACLLIRDIGAFHDLVNAKWLLAERAQDIFSIIQQDEIPLATAQSLRIRQLIFRNHSFDIL